MALRVVPGTRLRRVAGRRPGFVALAAGVYLAAAVVVATPAIRHARTHFLAGGAPAYGGAAPGDHLQTSYRLWLVGHQLERGKAPWRDPYSFRPEASPSPNPAGWPYGLPYWALWRALGTVLAWNAFVLLTFVAAGAIACAWLRELGLSRGPALAGGLVFAIAPYRAERSAGHLLGPVSILLPLALWAFERGRRGRTWWSSWIWYLLAAASLASIPLSGQVHLAMGAIAFFAAYAIVRTRGWMALAAAAAAALAAVGAGLFIRATVIEGSLEEGGRSLAEVDFYSAEWLDFVTRHDRHGSESFVFLGWATPVAAALGLWLLWRRGGRGLAALLGLGALVPVLLALGTNTPLYRAARFAFPPLRYPRVPERLMPIACLVLAALVAFAVAELERRGAPRVRALQVSLLKRRRARWLAARRPGAVLVALVLPLLVLDLRTEIFEPSAADPGNRAYAALRSLPPGRLLELPVFRPDVHFGSVYLYYDVQARRQRPLGYSTTAPAAADEVARRLQPLNCGDWTTRPGPLLNELGVSAIVLHRGLFTRNPVVPGRAWFAWRGLSRAGFRVLSSAGPVTVFVRQPGGHPLPPPIPTRDGVLFCEGWYPNDGEGRRMSDGHAAFWAYDSGDLRLFVRADPPLRVRFSVDGRTAEERRVSSLEEVRLTVGGRGWHLVSLDGELPKVDGRPAGARLVAYALS